ncbi:M18 aminopeptidase I zinc metalloprotease [Hamiltosporidium tvaerminnensis]|uniref:aspartyl aminopeptidase n=1 Tax=Hamiltosporidium tvaerminnensis TaxID=1176355 RepID=A0A4Q9LPE4_9MICR|nr:M18 aminopeptidase I zinc metalloprotease [Hamiltosporidium tvaerminnensis]
MNTKEYLNFLKDSPTPYHATQNIKKILLTHNFKELKSLPTDLQPGKYFLIQHLTLLIAFIVPPKTPTSIKIVATHNDSPVLKLKPNHQYTESNIFLSSLQPYGGGLWHTWFDRPLGVAGLVITQDMKKTLININEPFFYIPSLAIHLDNTGIYKNGFQYDKETHLNAITDLKSKQDNSLSRQNSTLEDSKVEGNIRQSTNQNNSSILNYISKKYNLKEEILSHDLSLFDLSIPQTGGVSNNFIFSARQDNLFSTFCAIKAITDISDISNTITSDASNTSNTSDTSNTFNTSNTSNTSNISNTITSNTSNTSLNIVAVFDNEEIGSTTVTGARSDFFIKTIKNIICILKINLQKVYTNSIIVSTDVAHCRHPNYTDKSEKNHSVLLGEGVVIKYSNRYATDIMSSAVMKRLFLKNKIKYQEFVLKNNMVGGSTIGPMLAFGLGIRGVDIGAPLLGMHSVSEVSCVYDLDENILLFKSLFEFDKDFINLCVSGWKRIVDIRIVDIRIVDSIRIVDIIRILDIRIVDIIRILLTKIGFPYVYDPFMTLIEALFRPSTQFGSDSSPLSFQKNYVII